MVEMFPSARYVQSTYTMSTTVVQPRSTARVQGGIGHQSGRCWLFLGKCVHAQIVFCKFLKSRSGCFHNHSFLPGNHSFLRWPRLTGIGL